MDINIVKEWGRKNVPYITNEDMLIKLYKAKVLNEKVHVSSKMRGIFSEIKSLELGVPSLILATVEQELRDTIFKSCSVCRKKDCNEPEHAGKMETKDAKAMIVMDNTAEINTFLVIPEDKRDEFKEYPSFCFYGTMEKENEKYGNGVQFLIKRYVPFTVDEAKVFMEFVNFCTLHQSNGEIPANDYYKFVAGYNRETITKIEECLVASKEDDLVRVNVR